MKKIINLNIISWFLGIVFYFSFLQYLWTFDFINALIILLIATISFPPSFNLLNKQLKKYFSFDLKSIHRLSLLISLFIIFNFINSVPLEPKIDTNNNENKETIKSTKVSTHDNNNNNPTTYEITKIIDGDTIKINIDEKEKTIRLIGINTPETIHPDKPVECFGQESSQNEKIQGCRIRKHCLVYSYYDAPGM
jgi:hypothetical protein